MLTGEMPPERRNAALDDFALSIIGYSEDLTEEDKSILLKLAEQMVNTNRKVQAATAGRKAGRSAVK